MTRWHILTGEYPPIVGGVADYTQRVAMGLAAAGDVVEVWAPGVASTVESSGVVVHGLPDHFGPRAFQTLGRALEDADPSSRILVQYVPHAFGWKGGNVPFCVWLRAQRQVPVWVMFHEVAFPLAWRQRWAERGLGVVTHGMAALVASAAERVFVSIPAWETMLRRVAPWTPVEWLPVPSTVDVHSDRAAVRWVRGEYGDRKLIGHVGTFGRLIRPLLDDAIAHVLPALDGSVLLMGRGSDEAARDIGRRWPELAARVVGTGALSSRDLSHHVAACDVMLQPYPDGISSRRTSAMVALAHGRPLATTTGALSEPLWRAAPGVALCPVGDAEALARASVALAAARDAEALSDAVRAFYTSQFDVAQTIAALREWDAPSASSVANRQVWR